MDMPAESALLKAADAIGGVCDDFNISRGVRERLASAICASFTFEWEDSTTHEIHRAIEGENE